jgi:hypothetical protein
VTALVRGIGLCLLVLVGCGPRAPAATPVADQPSPAAVGASELPIFDAHLHYSRISWDTVPADRALDRLRAAGVRRALVSSTPDEGTLRLYERAPDVVVPMLRPYRTAGDSARWTEEESNLPYLEARLASGLYAGIGEVHLSAAQTRSAVVRGVMELVVERGLLLHVHGDDLAVEALLDLESRVALQSQGRRARILWAHAGLSAGPERVRRLLEQGDTLLVELALRSDVAPGGELDPAWRELFLRYSDRFMVGTDTWINDQWERYGEIQREKRAWLAQLPRDVATQIAHANAERIFGAR